MGTAYHRSWSFSRQALYNRCPRAFFFEYFPWGEPNQKALVIRKRLQTLPLLIGSVAHRTVGMALRQFQRNQFVYPDITDRALIDFDAKVRQSMRLYPYVRKGTEPPNKQVVLQHHVDNGPSELLEDAARQSLISYIRNFQNSQAWEIIQKSDVSRWEHVNNEMDTMRTVEASKALGFKRAFGLVVYTEFDLALRLNGEFIIVDWKTGKKTPASVAEARKQTVGYSLWARERGIQPNLIRVQPFWLHEGELWEPQPIQEEELDAVRRTIEDQFVLENKLIKKKTNEKGQEVYVAKIEDFQTKPSGTCRNCKFRDLCPEGKAVTDGN